MLVVANLAIRKMPACKAIFKFAVCCLVQVVAASTGCNNPCVTPYVLHILWKERNMAHPGFLSLLQERKLDIIHMGSVTMEMALKRLTTWSMDIEVFADQLACQPGAARAMDDETDRHLAGQTASPQRRKRRRRAA